jgi:hypothetical protein
MKTLRLYFVIIVVTVLFLPTFIGCQSVGRPTWPKLPARLSAVYIATPSETIPLFPSEIPQYRDTGKMHYWEEPYTLHGTIRISEGDDWATIPDFPHNGNHCGEGLFMIRWRTSNPDVLVASNVAYSPEPSFNEAEEAKTGSFGYMLGTNCEQPLFRFAGTRKGNESHLLVDIHYELKFWQAAP